MGLRRRADRRVNFQFHPFYSVRAAALRPPQRFCIAAGGRASAAFGILTQTRKDKSSLYPILSFTSISSPSLVACLFPKVICFLFHSHSFATPSVTKEAPTMSTVLPHLLSGISVGGQYALIAIGYTMVYGIQVPDHLNSWRCSWYGIPWSISPPAACRCISPFRWC